MYTGFMLNISTIKRSLLRLPPKPWMWGAGLWILLFVFSGTIVSAAESSELQKIIMQDLIQDAHYFLRIEIRETAKDVRELQGEISSARRQGRDTVNLQNELGAAIRRIEGFRSDMKSDNIGILSTFLRERKGIVLHGDGYKQMYCRTQENIKKFLGMVIGQKQGKPMTVIITPGLDPSIRCP